MSIFENNISNQLHIESAKKWMVGEIKKVVEGYIDREHKVATQGWRPIFRDESERIDWIWGEIVNVWMKQKSFLINEYGIYNTMTKVTEWDGERVGSFVNNYKYTVTVYITMKQILEYNEDDFVEFISMPIIDILDQTYITPIDDKSVNRTTLSKLMYECL